MPARSPATSAGGRAAVGTTTALVFGSAFPAAQDALFEESARTG
jgi:guanine deaminase